MRLPNQVKVGPIRYSVSIVKDLKSDSGANLLGQQDHTSATIHIHDKLKHSPDVMVNTLLHELMHALWKNAELPDDIEEHAVSLLTTGLQALLVDNPKLLELFRAS